MAVASFTACGPAPGSGGTEHPTAPRAERNEGGANVEIVDPRSSGPVSLSQLLAYAGANAPALVVARQRAKVGDAEVEGAEVLVPYNPQLNINAGGRTSGGVTGFEFGVSLQQRIEIAGERGARIEAAERSRDARQASADVVAWEVHVMVHALYYRLLVRKKQLEAAEKLASFTKSVRETINKRVEAGEDSPLKTIVADAELAKASQLVIAARQAQRVTSLNLAEVVGWPTAVPLAVEGDTSPPAPITDASALTARALEEHPSKRWLVMEIRAAEARVEREDLEATPEPSIGINYDREAAVGGAAAHVWTGSLTFPIPLWQRNQAGRAQARAELGVAKARRSAFEVALGARIQAAAARVEAARERAQLFGSDLLPAFEDNLKKLKRAFELGEIDVLELAQIQERILVTQRAALRALEDYYAAVAALEGLSGVDLLTKGGEDP